MQKDNPKLEKWKKENPQGKGELSWNKDDYEAWDCEVPERIQQNPLRTEGEMMTEAEIEAWVIDTLKTLSIVKEESPETFERLYKEFVQDLEYLKKLGKVGEEVIENIKDIENFDF